MSTPTLQQIVSHTKAYGFLYNSSEIYEGLQAVYDYGPYGILLKRNLQALWWRSMVQMYPNIVGLDAAILMASATWEASGHLANFHDWMVDNKDSKKRYRVDTLLEIQAANWRKQGKEIAAKQLLEKMHILLAKEDGPGLTALLQSAKVNCPVAKNSVWTEARRFNLMFATQVGAVENAANTLYLRPETAQGIFVNFLHIQKTTRLQVPFGVAQIGKAFRNEIVARQFIFRMREFEQMEMQFFVAPGEEEVWFDYWVTTRERWYAALGIPKESIKVRPHEQLAHYASAAVDLEYAFPFGYREVEGIHSRMDFDLRNHTKLSKKKLHYFDSQLGKAYIPHVIETSAGCDRLMLLLLCHAFTEVKVDGKTRIYLNFPPALAPVSAAILPLYKKAPLVQEAKTIFQRLCAKFQLAYEEKGSIGKRYTHQDLIGTPYCITIDYETLEDKQVTVRDRNTMAQTRVPVVALEEYLGARLDMHHLLTQYAIKRSKDMPYPM